MAQVNKLLKVLVTTSMVLGSYACNDSKTVEEYQAEAETFIQSNDQKSAIIALKNANAIDPENAKLRFDLGLLYLNEGDYLGAEKELERAETLGFDSIDVLPELVEVKFKLNKFEEVYSLAESAKSLSDATYVKALTYAGLSALYQNKRGVANEYIDLANSISSESVYGQIGKAYLANSEAETKSALRAINSLIAYAPELTDSYLLKGYLLQGNQSYIESAEAFEKYAELRPKEYQIQFFIAQNYIRGLALDKAEPIINRLLKQTNKHPLANQMKAQIEFQRKNYQLAKSYGITAYQQSNSLTVSTIIAGMSAYYLEDYEQAYAHLIKAQPLVGSEHAVNKVLIELQLRLGYNSDAIDTINELISDGNADASLLTAASGELLKSGNTQAARELLQESIKLNSSNPEQVINQGIMKLKLNDLGGIEILEKALEVDPTSNKAESGLALGYLQNKQYEETLTIARKWQAQEDKKVRGLLLEAEVRSKQGKIEEAKHLLNQTLAIESANVPALFRLALYAHQAKDYLAAFDYYKQVINSVPSHVNATKGIITLAYNSDSVADLASDFYQEKIKEQPDNSLLKLNLSYIYVAKNEKDKALALLEELKSSPTNTIEGIDLVIGDIYASKKDWKTSLTYYVAMTEQKPNSLKAANKLYANYEKLGKLEQALSEVKRINTVYPDNLGLLLAKVNYQSKLKIKLSKRDITTLKNHPKTMDHWILNQALGNAAFINNDMTLATSYYQKSYDAEPNRVNVIALSRSLARSESVDASITLLKQHLASLDKSDTAIQAMLANAYLNQKNLVIAELIYLDMLIELPKNILALNNLSFIYHEFNNADKAIEFAKKALREAPDNAAVIDTYGQALLLNKQADAALQQFNKVLDIAPNNTDSIINKAKAYIQLGDKETAITLLSTIKAADVNNEKANKLLETL